MIKIAKLLAKNYGAKIQASITYVDGSLGINNTQGSPIEGNEWLTRIITTISFVLVSLYVSLVQLDPLKLASGVFRNGKIDLQCNYKNGKNEGMYTQYFENGQIKMKGYYKIGKKQGIYTQNLKVMDSYGSKFHTNYFMGKHI